MSSPAPRTADPELLALFRRFPREQALHLVPALVFDLLVAQPDLEIPAPLAEVVLAWMTGRGLDASATPERILEELRATYAEKPIPFELRLSLEELSRMAPSLGSLFGKQGFVAPVSGPAPPGAIKANPLARFILRTKQ
jgi:hypothetical protein